MGLREIKDSMVSDIDAPYTRPEVIVTA